MKPLDCMCPKGQHNNVPLNEDVWMMALRFGDFCNIVYELHCLTEVLELEPPTNLVVSIFFDFVPSGYSWQQLSYLRFF